MAEKRFAAALIGVVALVALLLASVGDYGVASYSVAQRSRELGIRSALGAGATDLVRLVLRQGMIPVFAGLASGCVGALFMGRLLSGLLFGVQATARVPSRRRGSGLFGVMANYLPARRAGKWTQIALCDVSKQAGRETTGHLAVIACSRFFSTLGQTRVETSRWAVKMENPGLVAVGVFRRNIVLGNF
jgi:hypothetical protein